MSRKKTAPVAPKAEPEKNEDVLDVVQSEAPEATAPETQATAQAEPVGGGETAPADAGASEQEQGAGAEKEPEVVPSSTMVLVRNLKRTFFLQPDTGLRIEALAEKELRNDSWLQLQIRAGLLELMK